MREFNFIFCRKGAVLNGYGSYGENLNMDYETHRFLMLDKGIMYAFAHVRGGGELGKEWYAQGRKSNKINSFVDFAACANYICKHYTSSIVAKGKPRIQ